ncbi:beta-lactam-binding protein with PASTA domain [Nakamurella sp. UYEF19]|uniref:PASTA domain-containing protein n=1 Tax=Nakamurella sp. UYEF19 TaxID=1756392 RepID=UPI00339793D2
MNEPLEDRLRRVLSSAALAEVPDTTPVPPLRPDDLAQTQGRPVRRLRRWLAPAITGAAAAVIAVVATVIVVRHSDNPIAATPTPTVGVSSSASAIQAPTPAGRESTSPIVTSPEKPSPAFTSVPTNLVGKSFDQAAAELRSHGLTAIRQTVDSTRPAGEVIALADIAPGAWVQAGTPIRMQVSKNNLFTVPDVSGLTPTQAEQALNAAGWTGKRGSLRLLTSETTDPGVIGTIPAGSARVVDQSTRASLLRGHQTPAAKSTVEKTVLITVIVYAKRQVVIPEFQVGVTTVDQIQATMRDLGFTNAKLIVKTPAIAPAVPFTFVSISPNFTGAPVAFDTPITITAWGAAPPR